MSGKYDIETFINQVITTLQADLPAKIRAINTEKADNFHIKDIEKAHYFDDISAQVLNASPFIYYTPVNIETQGNGAHTQMIVTLAISIVFDNNNQDGTVNKVMRYSRCLREVIQENYKMSASASRLEVTEFVPVDVQFNEGSDFKMGGIHITANIIG